MRHAERAGTLGDPGADEQIEGQVVQPAGSKQGGHGHQTLHRGDRIKTAAGHAVDGEQRDVHRREDPRNGDACDQAHAYRPACAVRRHRQGQPRNEGQHVGQREDQLGVGGEQARHGGLLGRWRATSKAVSEDNLNSVQINHKLTSEQCQVT